MGDIQLNIPNSIKRLRSSRKKRKDLNQKCYGCCYYLSSTSAPASSNDFLIPSASSLETPSFTALGALSFNPRPVNSLTNLTTANLEPPAAFKITSNSDFSSAASPPSAPPPPAATATAAAAGSIPYSSFNISANSFF